MSYSTVDFGASLTLCGVSLLFLTIQAALSKKSKSSPLFKRVVLSLSFFETALITIGNFAKENGNVSLKTAQMVYMFVEVTEKLLLVAVAFMIQVLARRVNNWSHGQKLASSAWVGFHVVLLFGLTLYGLQESDSIASCKCIIWLLYSFIGVTISISAILYSANVSYGMNRDPSLSKKYRSKKNRAVWVCLMIYLLISVFEVGLDSFVRFSSIKCEKLYPDFQTNKLDWQVFFWTHLVEITDTFLPLWSITLVFRLSQDPDQTVFSSGDGMSLLSEHDLQRTRSVDSFAGQIGDLSFNLMNEKDINEALGFPKDFDFWNLSSVY